MSIALTKLDSLREIEADENNIVEKIHELDLEVPKAIFSAEGINLSIRSHRVKKSDNNFKYSIVLASVRSAGNAGSPTNKLVLSSGTLYDCEVQGDNIQDVLAVLWANRWNQEQSSEVKKV